MGKTISPGILLVLLVASGDATEGSLFAGIGPARESLAGGGLALVHDGSWQMANPASLAWTGQEAGLWFEVLTAEVEMRPAGPLGNPFVTTVEDDPVVLAGGAYYGRAGERLAVGFALYPYAGLSLDLSDARSVFGALGGYDDHLEYAALRGAASLALTLEDGWSVGLSLHLNRATLATNSLTRSLGPTAGDDQEDSALGFGLRLGIHHQGDDFRFAAAYTSRQWFESFADYDDLLAGPLDSPQMLETGIAWLCGSWQPALDYRFIRWSEIQSLGDPDRGFGWRDQHLIIASMGYRIGEHWLLRSGVSYGRSSIANDVVFINGLNPLIAEWHLGLGASWRSSGGHRVDLSVQHAPEASRTDNGQRLSGAGAGSEVSLTVTSYALGYGRSF